MSPMPRLKITHAEAERMKSKRTSKDLPFIKIKSDDPKQAEAIISGGFVCQKTGIIFRVEEFKTTPSILQCYKCQGFRYKAPNCTKNQKCVVCSGVHSHKNCPNKEKRNPKCANCRRPHVAISFPEQTSSVSASTSPNNLLWKPPPGSINLIG